MDEFDTDFIDPDYLDNESEFVEGTEQQATEPQTDFIEEPKETPRAKRYRLKVRHGINFLITGLVQSPNHLPDAAALIYHGPHVSEAIGNLADNDARVRKAIDFITEDTIDNPYALAIFAVLPLAIQVIRNHETVVEQLPGKFKVRIPFTKRYFRLPVKMKFSLRWTKNVSYEPSYLTTHILGNPNVQAHLAKRGINIAWPVSRMNGNRP